MVIGTARDPQIALQAGVVDRLSARIRNRRLDHALAQGTSPESSPALALRACRLTKLSRRRTIAEGLLRVIGETRRALPPGRARISPRLLQVVAARDELNRLADALASPGPVASRGVAQAWILVTDGTGPLYNAKSPANLRAEAASATNNLRLEE